MDNTPKLDLPYIMPSQAQKHVSHNEAIRRLDALVQLSVIDRDLTSPPGSPSNGDRYIVASGGTGAWEGWDLNVALHADGAWMRLEPRAGWRAWVEDEEALVIWDGAEWAAIEGGAGGGEPEFDGVGIRTSPDAANRLAVKTDGVLFSHDDQTPGSGDLLATLNKDAAGNDAGLAFQNGFSSRALLGLLADDDFTLKVSPDGTQFLDAVVVDKDTGQVSFPQTGVGDTVGPGSAADGNLAFFDGTSGKLLKDRGAVYGTGSWTPELVGQDVAGDHDYGGPTDGTYVRIGDLVFVGFRLQIDDLDPNAEGTTFIAGLPFAAAQANAYGAPAPILVNNVNVPGNFAAYEMYVASGARLAVRYIDDTGIGNSLAIETFATDTTRIRGSVIYLAS